MQYTLVNANLKILEFSMSQISGAYLAA